MSNCDKCRQLNELIDEILTYFYDDNSQQVAHYTEKQDDINGGKQ